jgi:hypothetical protein
LQKELSKQNLAGKSIFLLKKKEKSIIHLSSLNVIVLQVTPMNTLQQMDSIVNAPPRVSNDMFPGKERARPSPLIVV